MDKLIVTTLIIGESGVGKEIIADIIPLVEHFNKRYNIKFNMKKTIS